MIIKLIIPMKSMTQRIEEDEIDTQIKELRLKMKGCAINRIDTIMTHYEEVDGEVVKTFDVFSNIHIDSKPRKATGPAYESHWLTRKEWNQIAQLREQRRTGLKASI